MRVWIDQDLCTGDGLCVDHCHDVFTQLEDGIAYVTEAGAPLNDPGGSGILAWVRAAAWCSRSSTPPRRCPGECIFIEIDPPADADLDVSVDARLDRPASICAGRRLSRRRAAFELLLWR